MTHYGLKEGWYKVNGRKSYIQLVMGKWHYYTVLSGWHLLLDSDRVGKWEAPE